MNKHKLSQASSRTKAIKEKFKTSIKESNQIDRFLNVSSDIKSAEIIFPMLVHLETPSDKAFQWYFNGFVIRMGGGLLLVDPGADFYTRLTRMDLDLNDTRAIFISHNHIDHTASLAVIVDMLIRLGRPIDLIMPKDCINTSLPRYLASDVLSGNTNINLILLPDKRQGPTLKYNWPPLKDMCFVRLFHSTRHTFGFILPLGDKQLAYVSDTGYASEILSRSGRSAPSDATQGFMGITKKHSAIKNALRDVTHAVVNINDIAYSRHAATHLTAWDIEDIFRDSALKCLYLQHQPERNVNNQRNEEILISFFSDQDYDVAMPYGKIIEI